MPAIDTTPLPEVKTDRFRTFLRDHLDAVQMEGARMLITRRGCAMAGLVPAHEARALYRLAQSSEAYSEWKLLHRLNEERAMRLAVMEEADAARRRAYRGR